jgi:hypothetical protein
MRDELFHRIWSEKPATRSIQLGNRLPTIQPKRPEGSADIRILYFEEQRLPGTDLS